MASAPAPLTTASFLLLLFLFFSLDTLTILAAEVALFSHIKSTLKRGESLANNGSTLTLQEDCDLVLRDENNMIIWNSGSIDRDVDCIFWINKYGVVVISDTDGIPLWTTGNAGHGGNYSILLRPDRKLVIYGPSIWSSSESSTDSNSSSAVTMRAGRLATASSIDSSGYILYSSDNFIYRPSAGVLLKNGNYSLVLETTCTIHIRRIGEVDTDYLNEWRRFLRGSSTPTCKAQLSMDGQLAAYKLLFPEEGGLDDVWLRTWGSDFSILTVESIAALVDEGDAGDLLIYPMKQTLA